ncbi:hypothetical protein B0H15DRAFT_251575 [Mycena belliarum]|uniref:Uncharacterized protein n=1 Tax=Mycena belliarum TaxID=1033014 RepID=A0AAD6U624_9AGAR|nr:hypothetical protein B0H15DRAFT_251575 [Mycena belliae]
MSHQEHSQNSIQTRNRAATFGGSVRSILREPNTPTAGKSVRFFPCDAPDVAHAQHPRGTEHRPAISRSTPPEETLFLSDFDLSNAPSAMPRSASSSRYRRPSAVEVFSPFGSTTESPHQGSQPHLVNFFEKIDAPATTWGLDVPNIDLPGPLAPAPHLDGGQEMGSKDTTVQTVANPVRKAKKPRHSVSHDRNTSFSFGQAVFHSMDESDSKRSSSGKSSLMSDAASDMTSASSMTSSSSSPSVGRHRSVSDTVFVSMMRGSPAKVTEETNNELSQSAAFVGKGGGASQPDPFSANATTYYTPQTMIPTTPPQGTLRHARRASKEENIIFSLKTQLALQSELIGQFEADLRARDELVEVLGKRLAEAEEEDVKKRKFLRAWKKKVAELEKKCRFFEDEVEGSRQESMERSIMDEASSEALQMLHRQIAGLERERDAWRRTEGVLREEVRRLDVLAGDRLNEATMLKESLTA